MRTFPGLQVRMPQRVASFVARVLELFPLIVCILLSLEHVQSFVAWLLMIYSSYYSMLQEDFKKRPAETRGARAATKGALSALAPLVGCAAQKAPRGGYSHQTEPQTSSRRAHQTEPQALSQQLPRTKQGHGPFTPRTKHGHGLFASGTGLLPRACNMQIIAYIFYSRESNVIGICVAARFHPSSMAWTVRRWCPASVSLVSQRYSAPVVSAISRLSTNQRYLSILR